MSTDTDDDGTDPGFRAFTLLVTGGVVSTVGFIIAFLSLELGLVMLLLGGALILATPVLWYQSEQPG